MPFAVTQPLAATLPISQANVTGLTTALAARTSTSTWNISTTNVTSAQLLALDDSTHTVELLAAPGGRVYYDVHGFILHYRFATSAYNEALATNDLQAGYGTGADIVNLGGAVNLLAPNNGPSFHPTNLFQQTADAYVFNEGIGSTAANFAFPYGAWLASEIENKPFTLVLTNGKSLTGGGSTLAVRLFYSTIDGAP